LTLVIKKDGKPARQFHPFAHRCWAPAARVLEPGGSLYESLLTSVGLNGWDLAEPGNYTVQAVLPTPTGSVISNAYRLRVAPPTDRGEERLAQDFFTEDVGRVLTFDGSRILGTANDTLKEVCDALPDRKVAIHARVALAMPLQRDSKALDFASAPNAAELANGGAAARKIRTRPADEKEAEALLKMLVDEPQKAVETLGHVDYRYYTEQYSDFLAESQGKKPADEAIHTLRRVLDDRNVPQWVIDDIESSRNAPERERNGHRGRKGQKAQAR
jgi:hypothetical protein